MHACILPSPLFRRTVANGRPTHGRQRPLSAMSRWKMPSKGGLVAKARDIDGVWEIVISHEGVHDGPPRRTDAASKDQIIWSLRPICRSSASVSAAHCSSRDRSSALSTSTRVLCARSSSEDEDMGPRPRLNAERLLRGVRSGRFEPVTGAGDDETSLVLLMEIGDGRDGVANAGEG